MRFFICSLVLLTMVPCLAIADEEGKPNCKLTIQTMLKDGKKKVEIEEINTPSRSVCASEAQIRRVVSEYDPEEIENIKVTFGWRDLSGR